MESKEYITFLVNGSLAILFLMFSSGCSGCSDRRVRPSSERGVLSRLFSQKGEGGAPHREHVEWTAAISSESMGTNAVTIVLLSSSALPHKTERYRIVLDGKAIFKGKVNVELRTIKATRSFTALHLSQGEHVLTVHRARNRESASIRFDPAHIHAVLINVEPLRLSKMKKGVYLL